MDLWGFKLRGTGFPKFVDPPSGTIVRQPSDPKCFRGARMHKTWTWVNFCIDEPKPLGVIDDYGHFQLSEQHTSDCVWLAISVH